MDNGALVNLEPLARMALLGGVIALGPLAWVWARTRSGDGRSRLRALTLLTLVLTFDLVLFGAFTLEVGAGGLVGTFEFALVLEVQRAALGDELALDEIAFFKFA